jgi:hypothetical protein
MLYKYADILVIEVLFSGMCPKRSSECDVDIWNGLLSL